MKQEELQKLLDSLDEGPLGTRKQHHWDNSIRMQYDNISHLPCVKQKMRDAQKRTVKTKAWREARKKYLTGRANPEHSKKMKGRNNPKYGTGNLYIELTTGFKGYATDMQEKFGISPINLAAYAKNDRPMKSGIAKGKLFRKLEN